MSLTNHDSVPLKIPRLISLSLAFAFSVIAMSMGEIQNLYELPDLTSVNCRFECSGKVQSAKECDQKGLASWDFGERE